MAQVKSERRVPEKAFGKQVTCGFAAATVRKGSAFPGKTLS